MVINLEAQVFAANRPMTGDHIFDAAASSPARPKVSTASVNQAPAARKNIAIIDDLGLLINADPATSPVKQPMLPGESESSTHRCIKVAVGFAERIAAGKNARRVLGPAAFEVHITKITLDAEHEPVPLEVITKLTASNDARLIVSPRVIGTAPEQ